MKDFEKKISNQTGVTSIVQRSGPEIFNQASMFAL
jgi:hypothetical protein